MPTFVVKPVEGRMVPNPRVPGRIFGHEPYADNENKTWSSLTNKLESERKWNFTGGEFEVEETNDGFFRKAILHGDLEYVRTVASGKQFLDPELLRASVKQAKARAEEKLAAEAHSSAEAAKQAKELEAAAQGLTVEEFEKGQSK